MTVNRRLSLGVSLACVCLLSACACASRRCPAQASQTGASIRQLLPDLAYPVDSTSSGTAHLKDGIFAESIVPDSATMTRILLGKEQLFGDLNGDGTEDAVVTLVVDPGGSGTFTYLALVLNEAGIPKPLAAVLLGDRIILKSMEIQPGIITVTMLSRKPDEPMSTEPTVEVIRKFTLRGETLLEQGSR